MGLALALGALMLGATPAQAQAPLAGDPAPVAARATGNYLPKLVAKGSKGYKISVFGEAGVTLVATKGNRKKSLFASYTVPARKAKTTPEHLRARFGRFGKVDVRFVAKGKPRKRLPRGCKGKPDIVQRGVWKGLLRFKGQGGFTKVKVRSTRGSVTRYGAYMCDEKGKPGDNRLVTLWAKKRSGKTVTRLDVSQFHRPNARPTFLASQSKRIRGMWVSRSALLRGEPDQFMFSAPQPSGDADLSPKGPFSGTAEYRDRAWSGNLAVKLPGKKKVRLTGPGFKAELDLLEF